MSITHSVVTGRPNSLMYDVSAAAWNAAHNLADDSVTYNKLTGLLPGATAYVGTDSSKNHFTNYFFCNGTADDVENQAALIYVDGLGGGSVSLTNVSFNITTTLEIYDNTELYGCGHATVFYLVNGSDTDLLTNEDHVNGNFNIVIHSIKFDGNNVNNVAGRAIYFFRVGYPTATGYQRSLIHNCWIEDTEGHGIQFESSTKYVTVGECYFYNLVGRAVYTVNVCHYNHFISNVIISVGVGGTMDGFYLDGHENIVIGNTVNTTTRHGIGLINCVGSVISGNHVTGTTQDGIALSGGGQNIIIGNSVELAARYGIKVENDTDRSIVNDNRVFDTASHCVFISSVEDVVVMGNSLDSPDSGDANSFDGIHVVGTIGSPTVDVIIVGNRIGNSEGYNVRDGIRLHDYVDDCLIDDNRISGFDVGIHIVSAQCDTNWIRHNMLKGNTVYCIDIGADTILPTLPEIQLNRPDGGSAGWTDGGLVAPSGVDIDANDEIAKGRVVLQGEVQQVMRIRIYGYSNVIEAANNMLLRIIVNGGSSSEQWDAENIDVANHPSEETGGIVVNDVVHWIIDASDDADIDDLISGDLLEIMAVGEPAAAPDIATDGLFGVAVIEYV